VPSGKLLNRRDNLRRCDRAAILAALERQLRPGDKALADNTGYRRVSAQPGASTDFPCSVILMA